MVKWIIYVKISQAQWAWKKKVLWLEVSHKYKRVASNRKTDNLVQFCCSKRIFIFKKHLPIRWFEKIWKYQLFKKILWRFWLFSSLSCIVKWILQWKYQSCVVKQRYNGNDFVRDVWFKIRFLFRTLPTIYKRICD